MSVWYCVPSKRAPEEGTLGKWRQMGYKIIVAREEADGDTIADKTYWVDAYLGWPRSVNLLVKIAMELDPAAQWFVTGGDDYVPDLAYPADDIAEQCSNHFADDWDASSDEVRNGMSVHQAATFGVMQPTGDRWGEGPCTTCAASSRVPTHCPDCNGTRRSALLDRICGSPWLGREFCRRVNGGLGPLNEAYFHNFADEELQCVARKLGVLWQRRDLIHYHQHWARTSRGDRENEPAWAKAINDPKLSDWERSKTLFAERKAAGFPGYEPLALYRRSSASSTHETRRWAKWIPIFGGCRCCFGGSSKSASKPSSGARSRRASQRRLRSGESARRRRLATVTGSRVSDGAARQTHQAAAGVAAESLPAPRQVLPR